MDGKYTTLFSFRKGKSVQFNRNSQSFVQIKTR